MNIIDLSDVITANGLQETVDLETFNNMKLKCEIKPYCLTEECIALLNRVEDCPPTLSTLR